MNDCIFCKITKGDAPAEIIYSDRKVMAFLDIRPVNPGHTLVIPIVHAAGLSDLEPEVGSRIFKVAMKIATAMRKSGLKCEGINLFLADGEAAFQEVFHLHLHVIPRFSGDGFSVKFGPNRGKKLDREEMERTGEEVRRALGAHSA
jgi:histidine triad (HIT) family protein